MLAICEVCKTRFYAEVVKDYCQRGFEALYTSFE
jgi:hypothetical protein